MLDEADWALRRSIYSGLAANGAVPEHGELADLVGGPARLDQRLHRLHDAHQVVLDRDGSIRMALPFSAIPTDHVVRSGDRHWFANCAWDSLAIPAALGVDAEIEARWLGGGDPVDLRIAGSQLMGETDAFVHFGVPARRWWDDIVET